MIRDCLMLMQAAVRPARDALTPSATICYPWRYRAQPKRIVPQAHDRAMSIPGLLVVVFSSFPLII